MLRQKNQKKMKGRPAPPSEPPQSPRSEPTSLALRLLARSPAPGDGPRLLSAALLGESSFLAAFVAARGPSHAAALLRQPLSSSSSSSSLSSFLAASFLAAPSLLAADDQLAPSLLWPLRPDGPASLRGLLLELLASLVASSPRDRALFWLRHLQRLSRHSALLGRPAQLLSDADPAVSSAAASLLSAWLSHGDASQQTAARRELLLLGGQETSRHRARHELLGPSMRALLAKLRGSPAEEARVVLGGRALAEAETVADVEREAGGRVLFAGCVPQSGVFCPPSFLLQGLGCGPLQCELWPLPWTVRVEGPHGSEKACAIDPRMTGERALAYIAAVHVDDWQEYRLKVRGGRWIDAKLRLDAQCADGSVLELKIPPSAVSVEVHPQDEARLVPFLLSRTVAELLETVGRSNCGLWIRQKGASINRPKRWLALDASLLESGVDNSHVLRCEPRPRQVTLAVADRAEPLTVEVLEEDLAEIVLKKAHALLGAASGKRMRLIRRGRSYGLFGWATLAQQGVAAGEVLELVAAAVPEVYASAQVAPFIRDDPHLEADLHWEKGPQQTLLECASLNSLVALMTGASTGGSVQLIQMILMTHHSFTTSAQLLRLLIQRGTGTGTDTVIRVLKVLKQWLDVDHFLPDVIVDNIAAYLERDVARLDLKAPVQAVRNAMLRWARGDTRLYQIREAPPAPILPSLSKQRGYRLRDFDPVELARQITLPLFHVYSRIEARELFSQPWSSPKHQHKCPHVMQMITMYNELATRVATSIVLKATPKQRAKVMGLWLDVCVALQGLQNYHSLSAIVSGLGNASVIRLKHTKDALSKKHARMLAEMSELCTMSSSFKNLREAVLRGDPPKVPYLGIYLGDCVFIEDGNPNEVTRKRPGTGEEVSLIFMAKRQLFHKMVSTIQTWQLVPYNLTPGESIQTFLARLDAIDDKQMYSESLLREPRET